MSHCASLQPSFGPWKWKQTIYRFHHILSHRFTLIKGQIENRIIEITYQSGSKPANRPKASLAPKKRRAVHTFFAPGKAPKKGVKGALPRGNCGPSLVETYGRQFEKIFVFDWRFHCLHCPFQNFKRGWKTNPCNLCGSNDSAKGFSAFSYLGCYSWMCKELHCLTGSFFEFIEQQWSSLCGCVKSDLRHHSKHNQQEVSLRLRPCGLCSALSWTKELKAFWEQNAIINPSISAQENKRTNGPKLLFSLSWSFWDYDHVRASWVAFFGRIQLDSLAICKQLHPPPFLPWENGYHLEDALWPETISGSYLCPPARLCPWQLHPRSTESWRAWSWRLCHEHATDHSAFVRSHTFPVRVDLVPDL